MPSEKDDRVIASFYDCILNPALWEETLLAFAKEFGGTGGHFFVWNALRESAPFSVIGGLAPGTAEKHAGYYGTLDPRLQHAKTMAAGEWLLCHEVCDERFVARSEFYQDFFIPVGGRYLAGTRLLESNGQQAFVALSRPPGTSPFDLDDKRRLGKLTAHLRRAAAMHLKLAEQTAKNSLIESMVDSLSDAIAVASVDGGVSYANAAAEAFFLAPGSPVTLKNGLLTARNANDAQLLRSRLAQAAKEGIGSAMRVTSPNAPFKLAHLNLLPLAVHLPAMQRSNDPQVLVLISDPRKPALPSAQALQLLFNFTPTEARLAIAVAEGKTIEQYATDASVSVGTARYQLSSVLGKSGTKRQAELVSQLLSIRAPRT